MGNSNKRHKRPSAYHERRRSVMKSSRKKGFVLSANQIAELEDLFIRFETRQVTLTQIIETLHKRQSLSKEQTKMIIRYLKDLRAGIQDDAHAAQRALFG